ncbi:MAG: hypothetical protein QXG03_08660 [Halalkalicoccus sp.]
MLLDSVLAQKSEEVPEIRLGMPSKWTVGYLSVEMQVVWERGYIVVMRRVVEPDDRGLRLPVVRVLFGGQPDVEETPVDGEDTQVLRRVPRIALDPCVLDYLWKLGQRDPFQFEIDVERSSSAVTRS